MKILKTRPFLYSLFIIFYLIIGEVGGFEYAVCCMGGTIVGEQAYVSYKQEGS